MIKRLLIFSLLLLKMSVTLVSAQNKLLVKSVNFKISVDGQIDEAWSSADSVSGFSQLEPRSGELSNRQTVVKALQDNQNLYFCFIFYLDRGEKPVARIERRDKLDYSDDTVSVLLDSYNDKRTALLFQVNALGTLADAKINDDGKDLDYLWDTDWSAATTVKGGKWVVEIKIPFKNIQYKPGSSNWSCNFSRSIRANSEISWWIPVSQNYRVSQNGTLSNVSVHRENPHSVTLFPYVTARQASSNKKNIKNGLNMDGGLDVEYKYSSNLKANVAINPDFATVEGDKEQVNLTPWEIKFPEKRLFFQDGNDMFNTRIQTFYSRRIGDINYGGKVTGKLDRDQFNGLHAQTRGNAELNLPEARFNAFRIKGDILSS